MSNDFLKSEKDKSRKIYDDKNITITKNQDKVNLTCELSCILKEILDFVDDSNMLIFNNVFSNSKISENINIHKFIMKLFGLKNTKKYFKNYEEIKDTILQINENIYYVSSHKSKIKLGINIFGSDKNLHDFEIDLKNFEPDKEYKIKTKMNLIKGFKRTLNLKIKKTKNKNVFNEEIWGLVCNINSRTLLTNMKHILCFLSVFFDENIETLAFNFLSFVMNQKQMIFVEKMKKLEIFYSSVEDCLDYRFCMMFFSRFQALIEDFLIVNFENSKECKKVQEIYVWIKFLCLKKLFVFLKAQIMTSVEISRINIEKSEFFENELHESDHKCKKETRNTNEQISFPDIIKGQSNLCHCKILNTNIDYDLKDRFLKNKNFTKIYDKNKEIQRIKMHLDNFPAYTNRNFLYESKSVNSRHEMNSKKFQDVTSKNFESKFSEDQKYFDKYRIETLFNEDLMKFSNSILNVDYLKDPFVIKISEKSINIHDDQHFSTLKNHQSQKYLERKTIKNYKYLERKLSETCNTSSCFSMTNNSTNQGIKKYNGFRPKISAEHSKSYTQMNQNDQTTYQPQKICSLHKLPFIQSMYKVFCSCFICESEKSFTNVDYFIYTEIPNKSLQKCENNRNQQYCILCFYEVIRNNKFLIRLFLNNFLLIINLILINFEYFIYDPISNQSETKLIKSFSETQNNNDKIYTDELRHCFTKLYLDSRRDSFVATESDSFNLQVSNNLHNKKISYLPLVNSNSIPKGFYHNEIAKNFCSEVYSKTFNLAEPENKFQNISDYINQKSILDCNFPGTEKHFIATKVAENHFQLFVLALNRFFLDHLTLLPNSEKCKKLDFDKDLVLNVTEKILQKIKHSDISTYLKNINSIFGKIENSGSAIVSCERISHEINHLLHYNIIDHQTIYRILGLLQSIKLTSSKFILSKSSIQLLRYWITKKIEKTTVQESKKISGYFNTVKDFKTAELFKTKEIVLAFIIETSKISKNIITDDALKDHFQAFFDQIVEMGMKFLLKRLEYLKKSKYNQTIDMIFTLRNFYLQILDCLITHSFLLPQSRIQYFIHENIIVENFVNLILKKIFATKFDFNRLLLRLQRQLMFLDGDDSIMISLIKNAIYKRIMEKFGQVIKFDEIYILMNVFVGAK